MQDLSVITYKEAGWEAHAALKLVLLLEKSLHHPDIFLRLQYGCGVTAALEQVQLGTRVQLEQ